MFLLPALQAFAATARTPQLVQQANIAVSHRLVGNDTFVTGFGDFLHNN